MSFERAKEYLTEKGFGCKAKMIPPAEVEPMIGHDIGGVCPFGINEGVTVYLDESLKQRDIVYPAAGDSKSAVRLSIEELEECSGYIFGMIPLILIGICMGMMDRKGKQQECREI